MRRCASLFSSLLVSRSTNLSLSPRSIIMAATTPTKHRATHGEGATSPLELSAVVSPIKPTTVAKVLGGTLDWHDLKVPATELRPCATLATGQCFNWRPVQFHDSIDNDDTVAWVGVVGDRVVALRETPETTMFACLADKDEFTGAETAASIPAVRDALHDLFHLDTPLAPLVAGWAAADARLQGIALSLPGLRVLRQEPVECLFSFIVSSNNNISRIALILNRLRARYGRHLLTLHPSRSDESSHSSHPATTPPPPPTSSAHAMNSAAPVLGDDATREPLPDKSNLKSSPRPSGGSSGPATLTAEAALGPQDYYSFPTLTALALATEDELRALGLGYRARYIHETASALLAKPAVDDKLQSNSPAQAAAVKSNDDVPGTVASSDNDGLAESPLSTSDEAEARKWLYGLRDASAHTSEEVQARLMSFVGVGQKVADCAALFSLDRADIVPVDVHVWRIAERDLDPTLSDAKSLTPVVYKRVGDLFREKYPEKTGWAHSLLFAAELPGFIDLIPDETRSEMEKFKVEEKRRNAEKKAAKRISQANSQGDAPVSPDVVSSLDVSEQKQGELVPLSPSSSTTSNNQPSAKAFGASPKSTPKKKRPRMQ